MPRDENRAALCLAGALCLHASATLLGSCESREWLRDAHASVDPLLVDIGVELPGTGPGPAPGGGSPEPDPAGPATALPAQPRPPAPKLAAPAPVRVEHAAVREEVAPEPDPEAEPDSTPEAEPVAVPDSADLIPAEAPKLRPARSSEQLRHPTATAPDAAASDGAASRSRGYGPGANGGPGGVGSGWGKGGGVVQRAFAFGGPSGAFRADVCLIPETTKLVKDLRGVCDPIATFFTNVLDVPPRSFTEGFPGVTDRSEWFAIFYRGKFKVSVSTHYRFRLLSDDGAILFIDGHRIIDNDGQHMPLSKQMTIPLEAGEHDLLVQYYQGPRENIALQLFVRPDGGEERLLTPEL